LAITALCHQLDKQVLTKLQLQVPALLHVQHSIFEICIQKPHGSGSGSGSGMAGQGAENSTKMT
jgi:hypothetical protein